MHYKGLYEDLLAVETRARANGLTALAQECFDFRVDILMLFHYWYT